MVFERLRPAGGAVPRSRGRGSGSLSSLTRLADAACATLAAGGGRDGPAGTVGVVRGLDRRSRERAAVLRAKLAARGVSCIELASVPAARHRTPSGHRRRGGPSVGGAEPAGFLRPPRAGAGRFVLLLDVDSDPAGAPRLAARLGVPLLSVTGLHRPHPGPDTTPAGTGGQRGLVPVIHLLLQPVVDPRGGRSFDGHRGGAAAPVAAGEVALREAVLHPASDGSRLELRLSGGGEKARISPPAGSKLRIGLWGALLHVDLGTGAGGATCGEQADAAPALMITAVWGSYAVHHDGAPSGHLYAPATLAVRAGTLDWRSV